MKQRLSDKIAKILATGAGVVVVTLLALSYYYFSYTKDYLVKDKIEFVAKTTASSISGHVWNLDRENVKVNLRSILTDKDILKVELKEPNQDILVVKKSDVLHVHEGSSKAVEETEAAHVLERDVIYGDGGEAKKIATLLIYYNNAVADGLQRRASQIMLVVGFVLFSIMIYFIIHVTRRSLQPVEELTQFLLEDKDDAVWQAPKTTTYEVQALMDAVEKRRKQNIDHAIAVERQMEELRLAYQSAEELARVKTEFLSNMSHELRTPMHAILNYCNMATKRLYKEKWQDDRSYKYLKNIQTSGNRLLILINNLLDISKMESGKMKYDFAEGDFTLVVRQSQGELDSLFKKKAIKFKLEAEKSEMIACFDTYRMIQVVVNILANAIRYTPEKSTVTVKIIEPELIKTAGIPMIQCSIMDEGRGIPQGELERIFDKFVQSSKTNAAAGGTGLGLSICRQIVEAHRGRIWAENIASDKGAVFHFTLPKLCYVHEEVVDVTTDVGGYS